jgi:hypothetical protein
MPEQSEDLIVAAKPKAPLWKRVCAWTIILGLYAATLAMVVFAVTLVQHSFRSGTAIEDRLCLLLGAGMLLGVPSENGPYRTLVLSGGWNPSVERRHGNAEIAGYISWWHPAGEQFLG